MGAGPPATLAECSGTSRADHPSSHARETATDIERANRWGLEILTETVWYGVERDYPGPELRPGHDRYRYRGRRRPCAAPLRAGRAERRSGCSHPAGCFSAAGCSDDAKGMDDLAERLKEALFAVAEIIAAQKSRTRAWARPRLGRGIRETGGARSGS